ncbi:FkbM family methyltransferase [Stieleria magnilauensis]|uniref:Methyltransferase FkbM domain-containing protein n=1 Tax=Stieleria magnilauensis TaxID=2527963 RepID=A0ABX5XPL9_9BACT|nr:hypothetical protein TBK1r_18470 [Planctomycetes bacterium TBK1r]
MDNLSYIELSKKHSRIGELREKLHYSLVRRWFRHVPFEWGKAYLWERIRRRKFRFRTEIRQGILVEGVSTDYIQQRLFFFGVWEPYLTAWLEEILEPGDIFVDVGANIGYYSLLSSKLVGDHGCVIAVEASPEIYQLLKLHIELNAISNIRPHNVAATDSRKRLCVIPGPSTNIGKTNVGEVAIGGVPIQGVPLSELLSGIRVDAIKAIKIDVEGAEFSVLTGLQSVLGRLPDSAMLIVEISPELQEDGKRSATELIDLMQSFGFNPYVIGNSYQMNEYFRNQGRVALVRLRGGVSQQTDVVFSKLDVSHL